MSLTGCSCISELSGGWRGLRELVEVKNGAEHLCLSSSLSPSIPPPFGPVTFCSPEDFSSRGSGRLSLSCYQGYASGQAFPPPRTCTFPGMMSPVLTCVHLPRRLGPSGTRPVGKVCVMHAVQLLLDEALLLPRLVFPGGAAPASVWPAEALVPQDPYPPGTLRGQELNCRWPPSQLAQASSSFPCPCV